MREKLETLPVSELREMAKAQGLKGTSAMRKAELVELLCNQAEKEQEAQAAKTAQEGKNSQESGDLEKIPEAGSLRYPTMEMEKIRRMAGWAMREETPGLMSGTDRESRSRGLMRPTPPLKARETELLLTARAPSFSRMSHSLRSLRPHQVRNAKYAAR